MIAVVHLICGRICSGKSHYAARLAEHTNAVILSCDDLSLSLFPEGLGERHDEMMLRVHAYLHERAADIARAGTDVILEWGFWKRETRRETQEYYTFRGIAVRWYYMDTSDETLRAAIEERNRRVLAGEDQSYYVDEGLFEKMASAFEAPDATENLRDLVIIKR